MFCFVFLFLLLGSFAGPSSKKGQRVTAREGFPPGTRLDSVSLGQQTSFSPFFAELNCTTVEELKIRPQMIAKGSAKGVWKAFYAVHEEVTTDGSAIGKEGLLASRTVPVIVKRPIRDKRFVSVGGNVTYMANVLAREAQALRNTANLSHVASYFGGCSPAEHESLEGVVNVVEYLNRYTALVATRLGWLKRLTIAKGFAELLDELEHFEHGPIIWCDLTVRQFGISRHRLVPKIVDVDALMLYNGSVYRHASHAMCGSCRQANCFANLRSDNISEFDCDAETGLCNGFSGRTHVYAIGKLIYRDLLVRRLRRPPSEDFVEGVQRLIRGMTRRDASERWSISRVRTELDRLEVLGATAEAAAFGDGQSRRGRRNMVVETSEEFLNDDDDELYDEGPE